MKLGVFQLPRRLWFSMVAALTLAATVSSGVGAQDRRPQSNPYQQPQAKSSSDVVMPSIIVSPGEDYRIGPSDVIEVEVEDMPELSRKYRVSVDGAIILPILGSVIAREKTPDQLAALIAGMLRGDYLLNPQVSVAVLQINSRTYFVQGAVRRPGLYQIEGQPSLLKLLTIAGGLSENYGSTGFIIREIKTAPAGSLSEAGATPPAAREGDAAAEKTVPAGEASAPPGDAEAKTQYELLKVNINGLLRGNFDQDVAILPGDIVHIPLTDVFFVAGEVNAPGSFPLKEGTTLRQAVSMAQGTTFQAAAGRTIIFREDAATGKRQEIATDLPAVMAGKKADVLLQANDIIIIPNSRIKSIGGTLLRAFGVNATRLPLRYSY